MFGVNEILLSAPIGVQEMVYAVWLIAKGFNPTVIDSEPATTELNEIK